MTKTLMIVPYVSIKTFPEYVRLIIEGYSYKPDIIEYVPNDRTKPHINNQPDYKMIETFKKYDPTDYVIIHNSDVYLGYYDLEQMIDLLARNDKAFATGVYPINTYKHCSMYQSPILPTRIAVWKAPLFKKCIPFIEDRIKANNGILDDATYDMAEKLVYEGYECLVDRYARVWHVDLERDYKTFMN